MAKNPSIVFMGTPDFAVPTLRKIHHSNYPVKAVITATDKPAGRGRNVLASPVKHYAQSAGIPIWQPQSLKDPEFIKQIRELGADIFIVVAFRILPEEIWSIPPLGTINLHASLLPQYRGAAPINWALINGETTTGITTFLIEKQVDTGMVLLQESVNLSNNMTAGKLHDILMEQGAELVMETIRGLQNNSISPTRQPDTDSLHLKPAPKLSRETGKINWDLKAEQIHNLIRGLSPIPGAWTHFHLGDGTHITTKIQLSEVVQEDNWGQPGDIITEKNKQLFIQTGEGTLRILKLQPSGKKSMSTVDFLRGFRETLTRAES